MSLWYMDGQIFTDYERAAYAASICDGCGDTLEPGDEVKWIGPSLNCIHCFYDACAEGC